MAENEERLAKKIGDHLKMLREQNGLSHAKLGNQAGMDKSAYQRIEWGQSNVGVETLERILDVLEIDIIDFFCSMKKD